MYRMNVDKPLKKCTIHLEECPRVQWIIKEGGTEFKGIGELRRDGGWFSFDSVEKAEDHYEQKWRPKGYVLKRDRCIYQRPVNRASNIVCIANQAQGSPTIAEPRVLTIARWLIEIYTKHKLPKYADTFYKPLGYTKQEMEDDPNKVYSMILVAAYDRQPFTKIARGWESIWGTRSQENSLRTSLDKMGLLQVRVASELSLEEVSRRLRGVTFHGYWIDSDGAHTEYARTVKDIARLVSECQLLRLMMQTETPAQVESIFRLLHGIHGIGKTIASKIVMYTLREIGIGQIWRGHLYPAVEPILDEYHNARLTKELEQNFGAGIVAAIFQCLKKLEDPFAIDALYYIDRDEPELKEQLLQLVKQDANCVEVQR